MKNILKTEEFQKGAKIVLMGLKMDYQLSVFRGKKLTAEEILERLEKILISEK